MTAGMTVYVGLLGYAFGAKHTGYDFGLTCYDVTCIVVHQACCCQESNQCCMLCKITIATMQTAIHLSDD